MSTPENKRMTEEDFIRKVERLIDQRSTPRPSINQKSTTGQEKNKGGMKAKQRDGGENTKTPNLSPFLGAVDSFPHALSLKEDPFLLEIEKQVEKLLHPATPLSFFGSYGDEVPRVSSHGLIPILLWKIMIDSSPGEFGPLNPELLNPDNFSLGCYPDSRAPSRYSVCFTRFPKDPVLFVELLDECVQRICSGPKSSNSPDVESTSGWSNESTEGDSLAEAYYQWAQSWFSKNHDLLPTDFELHHKALECLKENSLQPDPLASFLGRKTQKWWNQQMAQQDTPKYFNLIGHGKMDPEKIFEPNALLPLFLSYCWLHQDSEHPYNLSTRQDDQSFLGVQSVICGKSEYDDALPLMEINYWFFQCTHILTDMVDKGTAPDSQCLTLNPMFQEIRPLLRGAKNGITTRPKKLTDTIPFPIQQDEGLELAKDEPIASSESFMKHLGELTKEHILNRGWTFTIKGRTLTAEEVSTSTGLLSVLAYHAARYYQLICLKELHLAYYYNEECLCLYSPATQNTTYSALVSWQCFIKFAIEEWVARHPELIQKKSPIPIDDLYILWGESDKKVWKGGGKKLSVTESIPVLEEPMECNTAHFGDHLDELAADSSEKTEKHKPLILLKVINHLKDFNGSKDYRCLLQGVELKKVTVDPWEWQRALNERYPWMSDLTARLARRLSIQQGRELPLQLPNLILLGKSGIGKTSYWRYAMDLLNHPFKVISLAGVNDSLIIQGTAAGWSTEKPGIAAQLMAQKHCANPTVVLDDLDRVGGSQQNGRSDDALLALSDPMSSTAYHDSCLQTELNASRVSWVGTAREEMKLSAGIRNRFEIFEVKGPDWDLKQHLEAAISTGEDLSRKRWGSLVNGGLLGLTPAQHDKIRRTRWQSLRSLANQVDLCIEENLYHESIEKQAWQRAQKKGSMDELLQRISPHDPNIL